MVADFVEDDGITGADDGGGKDGEEENFKNAVDIEHFVGPTDKLTGAAGVLHRLKGEKPRHIDDEAD